MTAIRAHAPTRPPLSWNGSSSSTSVSDQSRIGALLKKSKLSNEEALSALKRATKLAKDLLRSDGAQRPLLLDLIKRVVMHEDRIVIELSWLGVLNQLSEGGAVPSCVKPRDRAIVLTPPCQFQRRGGKMRLVIGDQSGGEGTPDLYSHRGPSPGAYMVAGALRWQCQLDQANRRSRAQ